MDFIKRLILIFAVLVVCIGCDQTTKAVAQSVLTETGALSFFGDTVHLSLAYNDGAFLSLGSSLPATWRLTIFSVGVSILLVVTLAYAFLCSPGHWLQVLAATLLLAGGAGNLIDRVLHGGVVIDFINLGIGPLRTGIFNVADVAITSAVLIFLIDGIREKRARAAAQHPKRAAEQAGFVHRSPSAGGVAGGEKHEAHAFEHGLH